MNQVCNIRGQYNPSDIIPVYFSTDSTLFGGLTSIDTTDIGKFLTGTTSAGNGMILARGTTETLDGTGTSDAPLEGYIFSIPNSPTTVGSTVPFYMMRLNPSVELEVTFSTLYSTVMPGTTHIGSYVGLSDTTTIAGAKISMGTVGATPGTSDRCWLRITGYDTARRKIYGFPAHNSSQFTW